MTPELLDAFTVASERARRDSSIRVLLITGTGSCFSSGADFKSNIQRDTGASPDEKSYAMYVPFLSLLDIEVPIIAALNGHTVGGGFGLSLVCDLRIGNATAKYGANFVRIGLAPGMAISYLLPRLIGVARANELLLTGALVDGVEAERIGILNRAVAAEQVMPVAMELARTIAGNAPLAVKHTKAGIRRGLALTVREAARTEAIGQAETIASEDSKEGIAALLEKRAPVFKGR
jgi:enoyl-CoA hydratase/carnithine racemase